MRRWSHGSRLRQRFDVADGDGRELTSTFCFDADPLSPNVLPLVPAVDALAIRRTDLLHATAQDDLMSLSLLEDLFSGVTVEDPHAALLLALRAGSWGWHLGGQCSVKSTP